MTIERVDFGGQAFSLSVAAPISGRAFSTGFVEIHRFDLTNAFVASISIGVMLGGVFDSTSTHATGTWEIDSMGNDPVSGSPVPGTDGTLCGGGTWQATGT
jgi:hypothetical protein